MAERNKILEEAMRAPLTNDVMLFLAWRAAMLFAGDDGTFTSATFSAVLQLDFGFASPKDGRVIALMLAGRPGIRRRGDALWSVEGAMENGHG